MLGLDRSQVRVITPGVGGGFGAQYGADPERAVLGWLTRKTGRPVRWVETRSDHLLVMTHGRDDARRRSRISSAAIGLGPVRGWYSPITAHAGRASHEKTRTHFRLDPSSGQRKGRKIGNVPVCWYRDLPGEPPSATVVLEAAVLEAVVLEAAGRYFASFVVDTADVPLPPVDAEVGIDLGLMSFEVLSNGRVVDNPRYLRKAERRVDPREPSG